MCKKLKKKTKIIILISVIAVIVAVAIGICIWQFCFYLPQKKMVSDYYNSKVTQFEQENKDIEPGTVDIVFLGDSLTDGYDLKWAFPQYSTRNRGIAGDTTFGLEKRLDVSVYQVKPKVAVMLIGANNFDTMMDNYERILKGFQENIPETKIVLLSLTSMTKDWARNNQIAAYNNARIKKYAEKYGYTFIDLYTPLLDPDTGEMRLSYTVDGGHFTLEGYEVITKTITPYLETLLAE